MPLSTSANLVLLKLITLFNKNRIYWILGGHTGLIIQGVNLEDDREIDICTTKNDLIKINKLLFKYVESPVTAINTDFFKADIGKYKFDGIIIEVMADPQKKFASGSWIGLPPENIHQTKYQNQIINVFTLESEFQYYLQTSAEKPKNIPVAKAIKLILSFS